MVRRPHRSGRSVRARAVLGVVAAAVMIASVSLPAAAAITMKGAILKTRSIPIGPLSAGGGRVTCPTGYRVTAGGAFFPVGDGTGTFLSASIPVSKAKAWYAAGFNASIVPSTTLTIVVWCLPAERVGAYVTAQAVAPFLDRNGASATQVTCPAGYRIVTGGAIWQIPGDPPSPSVAATATLSGTSATVQGDGWWAGGRREQNSAARLRVLGLCRPKASVGRLTTVTQDITNANAATGQYVSCPTGQRVLSVGAYPHPTGDPVPDVDGVKLTSLRSVTPTTDGKGAYAAAVQIWDQLAIVLHCRPRT